jgi:hypothetical protein
MLITFLVGLGLGAAWALGVIFSVCVVRTKESWKEHEVGMDAIFMCVFFWQAENAKLRLALAAGAMTDEGKRIAAMTMAALDKVIAAAKDETQESAPSLVTTREPACSLENKP